ncbi:MULTISPECIES: amino acid adenylation domain-containing protein [unclassified Nostoc]|uniref:amino acid adenylation domain-containing protein n=1 Tax=unclassified Nostoc TaxID=2593658 RepID=UPI001D40C234|nr:amino acid adenylation domain-containing protein [Nostoc sp. JL23]MBN3879933.1 amino acid adenylation domain-containing protein [Nostoc sp. JL23]
MSNLQQDILEISAKQHPDKEAVIYKNTAITYRELDIVSNQLALLLKSIGVEKGDRIGIYLNKSIEAVAAIFGILKAGAVYVPLDPSAPVRRVASIIQDCQIEVLISTAKKIASLKQVLPKLAPVRWVIIVGENTFQISGTVESFISWQDVLQAPLSPLPVNEVTEIDIAYILYTSGSTGTPKGVTINHGAALNFVNWSSECFQVSYSDRVSNHAPLHFDLSVFDIFTTLKAGGTVIIVPEKLTIFPLDLARFIAEQKITIWYSVPSSLIQLVLHGNLPGYDFSNLRAILFAGEVFPIKYLRQLMECISQAKYYNLYGPTETNVCTYYPVEKIPDESSATLPIGKACAENEVFAVNDRGEIATVGEVGELYVRGRSLMNGYWGRLDVTEEVLVSCSFDMPSQSTTGKQREEFVYRTGDLVRQEPNGNYIFLGRRDRTIKSRGYRIDLGEIETTLYNHPQVAEVAVVAIPDEQFGQIIKAVVVYHDILQKQDLASFCSKYLPKYMIPAVIEIRAALPKTSTGKVDRKLL